MIAGAEPGAGDAASARASVRRLIDAGAKPRVAAAVVAELTGLAANDLYRDAVAGRD